MATLVSRISDMGRLFAEIEALWVFPVSLWCFDPPYTFPIVMVMWWKEEEEGIHVEMANCPRGNYQSMRSFRFCDNSHGHLTVPLGVADARIYFSKSKTIALIWHAPYADIISSGIVPWNSGMIGLTHERVCTSIGHDLRVKPVFRCRLWILTTIPLPSGYHGVSRTEQHQDDQLPTIRTRRYCFDIVKRRWKLCSRYGMTKEIESSTSVCRWFG